VIDDGPFTFRKVSEGKACEVELMGPADPQTGVQFSRTLRLDADSTRVHFRATMKNVTGHTLEWSMQSVSQYDTSEAAAQARMNPNFWAFTPVNPSSSYLNRYHVRYGPAQNSAYYVVAIIWVIQLIVSPIWLRYFRFGPLEWGWRSLTYWKKQPMRLRQA